MKTKMIQIGNSRGVRIPKTLIEDAGLRDEVSLRIVESGLLIEGIEPAEQAGAMPPRGFREEEKTDCSMRRICPHSTYPNGFGND